MASFIVPIGAATWRAARGRQFGRAIAAVVFAGVVFATDEMRPKNVLTITTVRLVVSMAFEYWRFRSRIREALPPEQEALGESQD